MSELEQKAIDALKKASGYDNELAHSLADDILLEFLKANGNAALASAFDELRERIGFWYA